MDRTLRIGANLGRFPLRSSDDFTEEAKEDLRRKQEFVKDMEHFLLANVGYLRLRVRRLVFSVVISGDAEKVHRAVEKLMEKFPDANPCLAPLPQEADDFPLHDDFSPDLSISFSAEPASK